MTASGHWARAVLRMLLFLVLAPFVLPYALLRREIARAALAKSLRRTGVPRTAARRIAGDYARFSTTERPDGPA